MLFCGRLEPDKGIHKLMEALSKLPVPNIRLLIVGSPFFGRTQQSSLFAQAGAAGRGMLGDRVQFTGYIPNEDLYPITTAWPTLSVCRPWWRKPPGW